MNKLFCAFLFIVIQNPVIGCEECILLVDSVQTMTILL